LRRDARIYAEVCGYGSTNDAYHPTAPRPDGVEAARSMRRALTDGGVDPAEVDYVNAHGSSTPLGDRAEAVALREVFGERLAQLPVSGTKPLYGHPLGASGAIEAAIVCLALESGERPPAINYVASQPGTPEAALDLVGTNGHVKGAPPRVALSNSFGFGGINASLAFRRWDA
jgi:3-oxoacyl-[acyl-carrier-protein] synthase II